MDTSLHAELEFNKRRKLFIQDVPPVTHQVGIHCHSKYSLLILIDSS